VLRAERERFQDEQVERALRKFDAADQFRSPIASTGNYHSFLSKHKGSQGLPLQAGEPQLTARRPRGEKGVKRGNS
jgi:hypothetical protein